MIDYVAATALLIGAQYLDVRTTNKIIGAGGYEENWLPYIYMKYFGKWWGAAKIVSIVAFAAILVVTAAYYGYTKGPLLVLIMAATSVIPVLYNLRVMREMNLKLWGD